MRGDAPRDDGRDDKPETGHQGNHAKDEQGIGCVGDSVLEGEQADAEEREYDADLQRPQDAADASGETLIALEVDGDGCGFEEALAGFGLHVVKEFLVAGEALDEAGVDVALQAEDATPAAILEQHVDEPEEGSSDADEGECAHEVAHVLTADILLRLKIAARLIAVDAAVEAFDAPAALLGEVGEEIEVGVARDFGVLAEKLGELWIGAGDVVLVGEEGGVGFDDLGEGGAHADEAEK